MLIYVLIVISYWRVAHSKDTTWQDLEIQDPTLFFYRFGNLLGCTSVNMHEQLASSFTVLCFESIIWYCLQRGEASSELWPWY